jgi:hypothetical protein
MHINIALRGLVLTLLVTLVPLTAVIAGEHHSGTVLSVGSAGLVVDELGRAGKEQTLQIAVLPQTRLIDAERNPKGTSAEDAFTEKTISLAEVKKGDFVVVDATRKGKKLVADSVTVTLRAGAR